MVIGAFSFKKLSGFTPFLDDPVRLGNRTIGVNLGIFSSVFESVKGCVFSSTFLKRASIVKRLFYGFQSLRSAVFE